MEDVDLDSRQCSNKQTVKCKVVSVDLDTLREKYCARNVNQK